MISKKQIRIVLALQLSISLIFSSALSAASSTTSGETVATPLPTWAPVPPPRALSQLEQEALETDKNNYAKAGLAKRIYKPGDKVAIIGAGITGLSIVRSLLAKGVASADITVFEERHLPGGKVRATTVPNDNGVARHYEIGAAVIIPGRYQLLEDLIAKHGLKTRALDDPEFLNVESGSVLAAPTDAERLELKAQAGYYLNLFKTNPTWNLLHSPEGFRNVPTELEADWNEFMSVHGPKIDKLLGRLSIALGGSGFLMTKNPPFAAQIVRFISPSFLLPILTPGKGSRMFDDMTEDCLPGLKGVNGFQCLWIREASELQQQGVKFNYATRVVQIKRGARAKLTYQKQLNALTAPEDQVPYSDLKFGPKKRRSFEHVFYTGDLRYLTESPWAKSEAEKQKGILFRPLKKEKLLVGSIETYPYKSYLVRLRNFPIQNKTGFFALRPHIDTGESDRTVLLMRTHKDTDVFQMWSYGDRTVRSHDEVVRQFTVDMANMGVSFDEKKDLLKTSDWDYFPHATPKNGLKLKEFFDGMMATQGFGGLWLSSEALGFGLTIESYEQGRAFAEWFVDGKL